MADIRFIEQATSEVSGWERALYAFLAEKERRRGSRRTVEGYARMQRQFFGSVGAPDRVTSQGGRLATARPLGQGPS